MKEKIILNKTEDNSLTLYLPEYGENTHTIHGAYTEALNKHIIPSGICNKSGDLCILDIGFGLGYNILALLDSFYNSPFSYLRIISFEKEKGIADYLDMVKFNDKRDDLYAMVKDAFNKGSFSNDKIKIEICFGDARQNIKKISLKNSVDAVFHDPHSPGKNSELWTINFFKHLHACMKDDAYLTTYSFAPQIRYGLIKAGFFVGSWTGNCFEKEGTIASKSIFKDCFSDDYIRLLEADKRSTPYLDNETMDLERETIRINRIEAAKKRKELIQQI
ncbi:MAG TPA: MnmC family methyltransferase [Spirochaetota bacterium]|nr:MnmC family methyltransferase [Spirochaetota bacterium]